MGSIRIVLCSVLCMICTVAGAVPADGGTPLPEEEPAKSTPEVRRLRFCLNTPSFDRVFFQRGRADIPPSNVSVLEIAAERIRADANIKRVRIEAHADRLEPNGLQLSRRRAANVVTFLIEHGVSPAVLVPVGFGASCLPFQSSDEDNRAKNRAVFLVVLKRDGQTLDAPRCRDAESEKGIRFKDTATPASPASQK